MRKSEHVFGPVPSRRLGRSLGVDVVPFKTCTYDCVYCQLGRTTCKTVERKEWVPMNVVLGQLGNKLSTCPDYITLSGSGEPTLLSSVGEVISAIKGMTDIPVAVLTNGSLLWVPEVSAGLMEADLVIPSLDAGDEQLFRYVNRPHDGVSFDRMIDGLVRFRQVYAGKYWLEVFLLGGVTATASEVEKMAQLVERIGPDRVQLNTVTRPPAEDFAFPVARKEMLRLATFFGSQAEVIADYRGIHKQLEFAARRGDVLDLLARRPCTIEDLASGLGLHRNEAVKCIEQLCAEGRVVSRAQGGRSYCTVRQADHQPIPDAVPRTGAN